MPSSIDPKDVKTKKYEYLKQLYGIMLDQDADVDDALDLLNSKVDSAFKQYSDGENIRNEKGLAKSIIIALGVFSASYLGIVSKRNEEIVSASRDNEIKQIKALGAKAVAEFERRTRDIPKNYSKSLLIKKRYDDGKTLEGRFKTVIKGAEKTVINIIGSGMDKGKTAEQIAQDIRRYVKPSSEGRGLSPFEFYRRHYDTARTPRDLRSGSIEYNALRIARTEIATTNREVIYELYKDDPNVKGYKWILSPSHPKPDICDVYAEHNEGLGKGVWRKPPSTPHPNCFCGIEEYPPTNKKK